MTEGKELQHYDQPLPPVQSSIQLVVGQWDTMNQVADVFLKSKGFLPDHITSKEQALSIMIKATELGIPFTEGFNFIYPVKGRTTCMGQLLMALMQRHGFLFRQHKITEKGAVVTGRVPGGEWVSAEFTLEDAKKAGLLDDKDKAYTWGKYTKDMMFWRAVGRFSKQYAAGVTGGLILAEEVGVPVTINEQGEQVINGEVELDSSGAEIPLMTQEQLDKFLELMPGEGEQVLFADFLFERGSIEAGEDGQPSLATLMEPVARDLLERWDVIQGELFEFIKKKKEPTDPGVYRAFRQDLINAGYNLMEIPEEGSAEADALEEKKKEVDALIKEHKLDGAKLKKWFNEKTKRFSTKIGQNKFKNLSFGETSLDVLQDILDTADQWLPLAIKAGLVKETKKKKANQKRKPPES